MIPVLVGMLTAVAVAVLAKSMRFDQDRSFYPTVLVVIAAYYILFAVMGGSGQALAWELVAAVAFSVVAIMGALHMPVLVGVGIVAHGLFDLVHHMMIENAGVPDWWPGFCGSLDVVLGLWVIGLSRSGRSAACR
ncbi:MAG: hypothetical protein Q8L74_02115 [Nitrospirota bacterium]|nr:hypothetical protein [Nitrospirota bacterium]MDP2382241.1 hypothetical protein [Nitrospirota bacterium]MDP3599407.1 hypothetical protein [Nitrospirota bacterium]